MDDDKQNMNENQFKTLYESESSRLQSEEKKNYKPIPLDQLSSGVGQSDRIDNYSKIDIKETAPNQDNSGVKHSSRNIYFIIGGVILFFIIVFGFFVRLFFSSSEKNKEIDLVYWGLWEDKSIIQPLIDQYQTKNPNVKINYQKMDPNGYRDRLIVRSQQNNGPDIFRFHNTWIPEIKTVLSAIPKGIMSESEFEKTFYEIYHKDLKINNSYFGIPLMLDGLVMVYNENLFNNVGIKDPPETWEDIINSVGQLTVKDKTGKIVTSGIALGTASNISHFSDIFCLFLLQNGADLTKLDTPEASGALESYRKFAEQPDNYWDENMPDSIEAFIQEKTAMIIIPSWELLRIKSLNNNLNFKVIPVPKLPQANPVSIASYWVDGVSKYSDGIKQLEAWKFLKYLSEKETMARLFELQSNNRLFGTAPSRIDLAPIAVQNEYIGPVIKQAKYFKSSPGISNTYDNGLNDEIIQYIENSINETINGESYDAALKTAKEGIDKVIERYAN
jgi:multiple sugar transport system substrate-binding protein